MTPKQEERLRTKIKKIKATLAAEKRRWGWYDDSRGLRYAPPQLFIQLNDYSGGLRYLNWFAKTFPDDSGYPDFLFEWTLILFKTGKLKQAQRKAFETFTSNVHLFEVFLGNEPLPIDMRERSNLSGMEFATQYFAYRSAKDNFHDFATWIDALLHSDVFNSLSDEYIDIQRKLNSETDQTVRRDLLEAARKLESRI